jgi:protein gp37
MARRLELMGNAPHYAGTTKVVNGQPVWTGKLNDAPDHILMEPLRRTKPTMWFVNSMSDLFHEDVPDVWIDRVMAVIAICGDHTFQVLTKRPKRAREYLTRLVEVEERLEAICDLAVELTDSPCASSLVEERSLPFPNLWVGTSTERQQEADERIPDLLNTPAAVRFVSAEPLLGPIDFRRLCLVPQKPGSCRAGVYLDALVGKYPTSGLPYIGDWDVNGPCPTDWPTLRLDWVIVGGESGPSARPMHPDWARSIRGQCQAAGVAFFFKQWGQWEIASDSNGRRNGYRGSVMPESGKRFTWVGRSGRTYNPSARDGEHCYAMAKVGKKAAGRMLDGRTWDEMPIAREVVT